MRRGLTLLEIAVVAVIFALLVAILLPAIARPIKGGAHGNCGANLSQMVKAMYNYSISCEPIGSFPREPLGGKWWLVLHKSGDIDDPRVFMCPVRAQVTPISMDYRGPATNPNGEVANHVIGCDRSQNHAEGPLNYVEKSGEVHRTPLDSDKWRTAQQQTRD